MLVNVVIRVRLFFNSHGEAACVISVLAYRLDYLKNKTGTDVLMKSMQT